jgi:hypothetical protein
MIARHTCAPKGLSQIRKAADFWAASQGLLLGRLQDFYRYAYGNSPK